MKTRLVIAVIRPDTLHHCLVVDDALDVGEAAGGRHHDVLPDLRVDSRVVFPNLPGVINLRVSPISKNVGHQRTHHLHSLDPAALESGLGPVPGQANCALRVVWVIEAEV